jgi:flagellar M-ring protein FliF
MATGTQLERAAPAIAGQARLSSRMAALFQLGRVRWAAMARSQQRWTVAALVLLAGLLGGLIWLGVRPDWRVLYSDLEPEDARQTVQVLAQAQIPFDVTEGGTVVRVPAAQLDKARLATAAKGGVKSGRMGFEIFDKPNWVGSEFDEQVNFQRALEGELEHTVGSLADVQSARVHLVLPHDSLFREQERQAKASVVLKLRHRALAEGEPEAIRNLVASAVDGLAPERVVLVDAAGHAQFGPKTAVEQRLSAEQALEQKLIATLEPVTGQGNVRASVTLDFDQTATEETRETYDPSQTVTLSMQRSEQTAGSQPVAAGVPGTASNAPNSTASGGLPVYPQQGTAPESAKTESGTYAATKTVRHIVETPGTLRRMTAAIVVNDRLIPAPGKGKQPLWQARSADELSHLSELAEAAVGFDKARGDTVTVRDLPFDENRSVEPVSVPAKLVASAENSPVLVKYAALLAGVLVVMAFGVRPALRRAGSGVAAAAAQKPLPAAAAPQPAFSPPLPAAEPDAERVRSRGVLEQVTEHLKREPAQSSRLLQSWIHSE